MIAPGERMIPQVYKSYSLHCPSLSQHWKRCPVVIAQIKALFRPVQSWSEVIANGITAQGESGLMELVVKKDAWITAKAAGAYTRS
jgi:hypothetical protein